MPPAHSTRLDPRTPGLPKEAAISDEDHFERGRALQAQNRHAEAAVIFSQVLRGQPKNATAHHHLGICLAALGRFDDAAASHRRALATDPDCADAHCDLGRALRQQGRLTDAEASYRRALALAPNHAPAHNNLAGALLAQGRAGEAVGHLRRALRLAPENRQIHSNLLGCLQYDPAMTAATLLLEHKSYGASLPPSAPMPHQNRRDPDKRLNIGFVSHDLHQHPVGFILMPVFAAHDGERYAFHCYYEQPQEDAITAFLKSRAAVWRSTVGLDDGALAAMIRKDEIDILVDLAGHTWDNRLPLFARKPAPVQVTWAGYEGTTGVSAIDYLITDRFVSPPGSERYAVEQLVRLPDGYVCWAVPQHAPEVGPPPARAPGAVTFGCFNNLAKINPPVIALWGRLLRELPASRLVLKTRELGDAMVRERLIGLFAVEAVAPSRIILEAASPHAEYLKRYSEIDVALDPFPYSGGATTIDALWMGVPVVTLAGERFAARHTLSYLAVAGLGELIAEGPRDYVRICVDLARDLPRLAALRAAMRDRLRASPLLRSGQFTRGLERSFRRMWKSWCRS